MEQIVSDEWLSKIIGKPTFFLQDSFKETFKEEFPEGEIFVWAKLQVEEINKLKFLQKIGFYIVDTNIKLISKNIFKDKRNTSIRFARPSDQIYIRNIAKNSFKFSRFHLDPEIPYLTSCKIKEEWAGNYFSGKRGKWMIVAEDDSNIVGFLQLLYKDKKTIIIDLIAVSEEYRGRGFAKSMISFALSNCLDDIVQIEVGTQLTNISSLKFYTNLGFFITSSSYVLHFHQKKQKE